MHNGHPRFSTNRFEQPYDPSRRPARIAAPVGPVRDEPLVRHEIENAGGTTLDVAAAVLIVPAV